MSDANDRVEGIVQSRVGVPHAFKRERPSRRTSGDDLLPRHEGEANDVAPNVRGKEPRVSRLLALAHKFDRMLTRREAESLAQLARAGRVTRARVTQIMNLTLLAPDIQIEILSLPRVERGRDQVILADALKVVRSAPWGEQRLLWEELVAKRRACARSG